MREARLIGVTTSSVTAAREVVGYAVRTALRAAARL